MGQQQCHTCIVSDYLHSGLYLLILTIRIAHSPNGWTDGELGLEWLKNFDTQMKEKTNRWTQVLLLDGHSSHYTKEVLEYAQANNIVMLGYRPHWIHALQNLDIVCFARMKDAWKEEINVFKDLKN